MYQSLYQQPTFGIGKNKLKLRLLSLAFIKFRIDEQSQDNLIKIKIIFKKNVVNSKLYTVG